MNDVYIKSTVFKERVLIDKTENFPLKGSLKNLNREGVKFIKQDFSLCSCGVVTLCPKCVKGQFKERSKVRKKDSFFVCVYF